jgi:hypothetical protein
MKATPIKKKDVAWAITNYLRTFDNERIKSKRKKFSDVAMYNVATGLLDFISSYGMVPGNFYLAYTGEFTEEIPEALVEKIIDACSVECPWGEAFESSEEETENEKETD